MKLRELLKSMSKSVLVEVHYRDLRCISDGAYYVEEILESNREMLDMEVPENGIELRYEEAEELVAYNSKARDEFFQGNRKVMYMLIEL